MTSRRLWMRFVVALALAGVVAGARSRMHASQGAGFPTLPTLMHGEGDDVTVAIAEVGFPNVTYSATGLPPGITMTTIVDVNGHVTGELTGTLPEGAPLLDAQGNIIRGTDPLTDAGSYTGSEGVYTVTVRGSDGSVSNAFTWDIGRWGSGDVFVGAGTYTYQVYDKDGSFKYDVVIPDVNNPNTWGGTTGCAANWHSGEVWTTNLDDRSPGLNVITRHAGSKTLPYTDASRRLATDWYLPISQYSVDISPESVFFDNDQNMYVGHTAGFANNNGDASDSNGNAIWLADPLGIYAMVVVDAAGNPLTVAGTGAEVPYDTFASPDGYYTDWSTGTPVYLQAAVPALDPLFPSTHAFPRIPVRQNYGAGLQKFPLVSGGYTNTVRSFFQTVHGQTGTDETDLLSDSKTMIYTSESQYVYRYDVSGNGTQLPVLGSNDINAPRPISPRLTYGLRALPPGDGTGGYLIANDVHVDRVDQNGRIVQSYDVKDDPAYPNSDANEWFSLAIAPDGRTFWLANRQDVYRIDIASGRRIGSKIHATDGLTHTAAELAGLCVMNEYRAAQEVCSMPAAYCAANPTDPHCLNPGTGNGIDDDQDGVIDEGCFRVEICSAASPGDDDGNGLVDYNDPACGAPPSQQCAVGGPTDASVAGLCDRANAEGDTVSVAGVPLPCPNCSDWTYSYTATGLPAGLSIDPITGTISGVPLYSIVNPNSPASPPVTSSVSVHGVWTQIGHTPSEIDKTVSWTLYNTNRPPVALDDSATVLSGGTVLINVQLNDNDPDGDPFTLKSFTQPSTGSVTQVGQQLQYTAPAGFGGVVTFTYVVQDNYTPAGVSNVATVTVIVNGPPVARNDSYQTAGGNTLTVNAANGIIMNSAGSDSDPEGQVVTVVAASVTAPGHGSVSVNPDGSFSYTPAPGFLGTDTFTYRVTDGALQSNVATVTIVVSSPPVAVNDNYMTFVNTPVTTNNVSGMLGNDSDPAGAPIHVVLSSVTAPAHGVVVPSASGDGSFVYTPATNYVGTDTFTYRNNNGSYDSNTATVTITIRSTNHPPVAVDDYFTVDQGVLLSVPDGVLLANDTDPDGDPLVVERLSSPAPDPGTLFTFSQPGGAFQFRSSPTFVGETTFTYRVTDPYNASSPLAVVHIRVNARPVAVNDNYTTPKNTALSGSVAGNDTPSADGGNVWTVVTAPTSGTLTLNTTGAFAFVPATGFTGTVTFTYKVCDVNNDCSTAVATIKVNDVPVAVNDSYTTPKNTALSGSVASNDTPSADGGNVWTKLTSPASGTLVFNTNGTFTYTPATGFTGSVSFTYKVCDVDNDCSTAVATIKINDVPVAVVDSYATQKNTAVSGSVASNDTPSADGGNAWTLVTPPTSGNLVFNTNGTFTFTPATGSAGTVTFSYKVCDVDNDCSTAVATIRINDVPTTTDDTFTTTEDTPVSGSVVGNDVQSVDGGNTWSLVSGVAHGTLTFSNGSFTYMPSSNYNGIDSFVYKLCDVNGDCSTSTAIITITSVNDVPVAVNDTYTMVPNASITKDASGNDAPSGDGGNVWTQTSSPASGALVFNANGTFTYTAAANFSGVVSFNYKLCDVNNDCSNATVTITIAVLTTGAVGTGDTATIGFWQNSNGQALIKKMNGSASATSLGSWLASSFPYLWGGNCSSANNLMGKTNTQVAAYYITVFKSDKWMAQVLAGAIATYVTNSTLAGSNYSVPYGFNYSATGTGTRTYNVGSYGTAIGLVNNTSYTIGALLQQANLRKQQGTYNSNAFNVIFSAINQAGDITK